MSVAITLKEIVIADYSDRYNPRIWIVVWIVNMGFKLGMNAKLYRGDALLTGSDDAAVDAVTWTEITNVKDVTLNLDTGEADVTTRANNGWRATAATLKDGSVEFEMVWDTADAGFAALKDAWLGGAEIAMAVMSGGITVENEEGLVTNFTVTNFSRSEPLEEAITVSVTIKPSSQTQWYKVPAA